MSWVEEKTRAARVAALDATDMARSHSDDPERLEAIIAPLESAIVWLAEVVDVTSKPQQALWDIAHARGYHEGSIEGTGRESRYHAKTKLELADHLLAEALRADGDAQARRLGQLAMITLSTTALNCFRERSLRILQDALGSSTRTIHGAALEEAHRMVKEDREALDAR